MLPPLSLTRAAMLMALALAIPQKQDSTIISFPTVRDTNVYTSQMQLSAGQQASLLKRNHVVFPSVFVGLEISPGADMMGAIMQAADKLEAGGTPAASPQQSAAQSGQRARFTRVSTGLSTVQALKVTALANSTTEWVVGEKGQACDMVCGAIQKSCKTSMFSQTKTADDMLQVVATQPEKMKGCSVLKDGATPRCAEEPTKFCSPPDEASEANAPYMSDEGCFISSTGAATESTCIGKDANASRFCPCGSSNAPVTFGELWGDIKALTNATVPPKPVRAPCFECNGTAVATPEQLANPKPKPAPVGVDPTKLKPVAMHVGSNYYCGCRLYGNPRKLHCNVRQYEKASAVVPA